MKPMPTLTELKQLSEFYKDIAGRTGNAHASYLQRLIVRKINTFGSQPYFTGKAPGDISYINRATVCGVKRYIEQGVKSAEASYCYSEGKHIWEFNFSGVVGQGDNVDGLIDEAFYGDWRVPKKSVKDNA